MPDFQYVYILLSECGEHHYVGCTADLQQRLNKHNNGDVSHTSKFRPWRIQTAVAFRDVEKAAAFERYLKSHSGCPQLPCGLPHVREGRPPRRPHCNRSPWRLRTALPGGMTSASSALPLDAQRVSAFPRSERVYPAIMPLGAISPGDPSWRKASRYVRIGRDDLHVVRTTAIIVASPLAEAQHRIREGRPPRRPHCRTALPRGSVKSIAQRASC